MDRLRVKQILAHSRIRHLVDKNQEFNSGIQLDFYLRSSYALFVEVWYFLAMLIHKKLQHLKMFDL